MTFTVPVEKEATRIDKVAKEISKTISYRLQFIDLWQAHYQILLIILLKDFIRLNVKKNMILKNVKLAELNGKISTNFLNTESVKVFK